MKGGLNCFPAFLSLVSIEMWSNLIILSLALVFVSCTDLYREISPTLCVTFKHGFSPCKVSVFYNDSQKEPQEEKAAVMMGENHTCGSLEFSISTNQSQFILLLEIRQDDRRKLQFFEIKITLKGSTTVCTSEEMENNFYGGDSNTTRVPVEVNYSIFNDSVAASNCTYREEKDSTPACEVVRSIKISFSILFNGIGIDNDTIELFEEGVIFSVRNSSSESEWISLVNIYFNNDTQIDCLNDTYHFDIGDFDSWELIPVCIGDTYLDVTVSIPIDFTRIQFRWSHMNFSDELLMNSGDGCDNGTGSGENEANILAELNTWNLDNVTITHIILNGDEKLYCPTIAARSMNFSLSCDDEKPVEHYTFKDNDYCADNREVFPDLFFNEVNQNMSIPITLSRLAETSWNNLTFCPEENSNNFMPETSTEVATTENPTTVIHEDPKEVVADLLELSSMNNDVDASKVARKLVSVTSIESTIEGDFDPTFVKNIAAIGRNIDQASQNSEMSESIDVGVTYLQVIETLLFNYFPPNTSISTNNTELLKVKVNASKIDQKLKLEFGHSASNGPPISISLPQNLLKMFADQSFSVNVTSAIYRNFGFLFSQDLSINMSSLASDIASASLQCGTTSCNTSDLELDPNVTITFVHSIILQNIIRQNESLEVVCAFLEIQDSDDRDSNDSLPYSGQWSRRGCSRSEPLSSETQTVCECNHLTHFALLLSPRPPVFIPPIEQSLVIIGYIGVTISVIAMTITVFVFIYLKSLHSMRNYIHINLCISLSIAQILFIAGIDKTGPNDSDTVPIHCQVIAVLLHYFFLVSFMWMLMEGIVLYVALVRVFIVHHKRYIAAFTLLSYGAPLLYVGLVCLPLGFYSSDQYYGTKQWCFLNHENYFMWAFISPVVLIFLANIGFLVMAAVIMYRHQMMNRDKTKLKNALSWFKGLVTLAVVMCLTWIIGLLIIEVEQLFPLAFIYTILVAFQGFFIFLIFIVFSKVVREAIKKWWKNKVNDSDIMHHIMNRKSNSSNGLTKSTKLHSGSTPSVSNHQTQKPNDCSSNDNNGSIHKAYSLDTLDKAINMEICDEDPKIKRVHICEENSDEEWPEYAITLGLSDSNEQIESSSSFPLN